MWSELWGLYLGADGRHVSGRIGGLVMRRSVDGKSFNSKERIAMEERRVM